MRAGAGDPVYENEFGGVLMNCAEDLRGRKFALLTVIGRAGSSNDGSALWICRCECGAERTVLSGDLRRGRTRSCKKCRAPIEGAWTAAEDALLRELYPKMLVRNFVSRFDRSAKAIRSRARVLRLKKERQRKVWTPADAWMLRTFYPHIRTDVLAQRLEASVFSTYREAKKLGLRKTQIYLASPDACRLRRETHPGIAFQFPKGHVPANKGTRRPGWSAGRMRETQFKKGQISRNAMPMWSFRFVDGYLMLKTGAPTPKPTTGWEYVHKLIWEQANGPLPHWRVARLWWKDGDHANCSLSNLELVTAQEHMRRMTIHSFPAPLRQVIQLKGALKRRIGRMEKQNAEELDGRPPQSPVRDDRSIAG